MLRGIQYIRKTIPQSSPIFTDGETKDILNYYLRPRQIYRFRESEPKKTIYSNYHLVSFRYTYPTEEEFIEDLMKFREKFRINPEESVWVVDSGWNLTPYKSKAINDLRNISYPQDFDKVLFVFKTPQYYGVSHILKNFSSK